MGDRVSVGEGLSSSNGEALSVMQGRCDAHSFIVRIRKEPSEIANLLPRWRGEVQHLHDGKQVARSRFACVENLLNALTETIDRVVRESELSSAADRLALRSPEELVNAISNQRSALPITGHRSARRVHSE